MKEEKIKQQDRRLSLLKRWIIDAGLDPNSLRAASSDASFRQYFRLDQGNETFILMDAPPEYNDNELFIDICNRLNATGLNVPSVFRTDLNQGFLLMKDLGSYHYLDALNESTVNSLYQKALSALDIIQHNLSTSGLPNYDEAMLSFELDIFYEWYINKYKQKTLTTAQDNIVRKVITQCINLALEQPTVFVHRDFHSRNLMCMERQRLGILDFQGAVNGPITYDLVSLLRDCYIGWPDELIYSLLEEYRLKLTSKKTINVNRETFERWFDFMGLQRHLKVLGLFCRLKMRDNKPAYIDDLPRVLGYVISICGKYPELLGFRTLMLEINKLESAICER